MVVASDKNGSGMRRNGSNPPRTTLKRTVGSDNSNSTERFLLLLMLGCENNSPYGPNEHTASLFLSLICRAAEKVSKDLKWTVTIDIYRAQQMEYPQSTEEWDRYDGILLPGSFSAAYGKEEWIEKLSHVIINEVHGRGRKTFGVCFGHQIYAHSLQGGQAVKCPAGKQFGRQSVSLTSEGAQLFSDITNLELLFTHSDMVQSLPPCAVRLGGSDRVPIQAAAYFTSPDEAARFMSSKKKDSRCPSPIAITFQAHPEYAELESGMEKTFDAVVKASVERRTLSPDEEEVVRQDVIHNYAHVEQHSLDVMIEVGTALGWFP